MKNIFLISFITTLLFSCQSPSQTFCAVSYYGQFTQIDPLIGEVGIKRTDLPKQLQTMSWSPNGILYAGTNGGQIYSINPLNGDFALAYTLPVTHLRSMTFSSDGLLYFSHKDGTDTKNYLKVANLTSGEICNIGQIATSNDPFLSTQGLAFSPEGVLYGIAPWYAQVKTYNFYTIDPANAEIQLIGQFSSTVNINQSLAFTSNGDLFAIGDGGLAQINPIDGTIIGRPVTLYGDYRGLEVLPEPISCFYLALGALCMIKKRKS